MLVMDRQDCINKSNDLLTQAAYRPIPQDPTNKIKVKLITIFKKVKSETGLVSNTYKAMYPKGCSAPKFHGLPNIDKLDTPSGLKCPAMDLLSVKWLKCLPKYLRHW